MSWLSGGKTPASAAKPYLDQIPGQTQQYYQPYFESGTRQLPKLEEQYNDLMTNPGGKYNKIGESFQQSPGFKFAMQQALQGSEHAANAGGMTGTPQHEQQNMQLATDLANQDYYNYMGGATGMYNQGVQGAQGMANQGQQAGSSMADMIAQALNAQANNAYENQAQVNKNHNNLISTGVGLAKSLIPGGGWLPGGGGAFSGSKVG